MSLALFRSPAHAVPHPSAGGASAGPAAVGCSSLHGIDPGRGLRMRWVCPGCGASFADPADAAAHTS